jgi:localization factor PodJL
MALETSSGAGPDPRGVQRQANLAAMSERLGVQARPASDFSGRFGAAQPAPAVAAPAAAPAPAATIVTGSNPAVKPQMVSTGAPPATPQAPLDTAVTENVSETAEMPPALVGPLSLRMAAAKGDPSAAFEVATRLAEGRGIKQDFKLAMTWYQRSANKGFAVAQYRLGTLYERGLGTPVDANRARVWYKRAADQGNVKAMHNMAVLSAGNGQTAPDYTSAAKWFKDAADRGLADSQFNLGVLNESGLGVSKDSRAAYVWFSLAARSGDAEAARRRDLLLATLDADTLKTADEQVRGWRARPTDVKVNDARVAGDQWRMQAQGQNEPSALPQPVVPPEPPKSAATTQVQATPAVAPRIIKAPASIR